MSWLSELFGGKKIRTPKVKPAEDIFWPQEKEWSEEEYLRRLSERGGFLSTILAGGKKPKLGAESLLR